MKPFAPLYKKRKIPETNNTTAYNGINGYDAEKMAASLSILASGGEIQWASRTEEGHKIDFLLSYENPVYPGNRLIIQAQVKSGDTYGTRRVDGFKLKTKAKQETQRKSRPVLVLWTDRRDNTFYWAYIHPRTKYRVQLYGFHHEVSPALRYDLARCEGNLYLATKGGDGVFLKTNQSDYKTLRTETKTIYKSFNGNCFSPIFGDIECTRVGWRHMFRESRGQAYRRSSCTVIKYLKNILSQPPSTLFHSKVLIRKDIYPLYDVRITEYIMHYKACQRYDPLKKEHVKCTIAVRLIEEVRYPSDWRINGIISQRVERKVTLLSCYIKEKK